MMFSKRKPGDPGFSFFLWIYNSSVRAMNGAGAESGKDEFCIWKIGGPLFRCPSIVDVGEIVAIFKNPACHLY